MQNKSFLLSDPKSIGVLSHFPFVYQNTMLWLSDPRDYFHNITGYGIINFVFGNSHMQTCWIIVSQGFVGNLPTNEKGNPIRIKQG